MIAFANRPSTVTELFAPLIGRSCWQVRRGHGSFVTIEFGEPRLVIREPRDVHVDAPKEVARAFSKRRITIVGQWHLWIQFCHWKLTVGVKSITDADLDKDAIDAALDELDGQNLVLVSQNPTDATCELRFEMGATLTMFPSADFTEDDLWTLHCEDGSIFAYRSDGALLLDSESPTRKNSGTDHE